MALTIGGGGGGVLPPNNNNAAQTATNTASPTSATSGSNDSWAAFDAKMMWKRLNDFAQELESDYMDSSVAGAFSGMEAPN